MDTLSRKITVTLEECYILSREISVRLVSLRCVCRGRVGWGEGGGGGAEGKEGNCQNFDSGGMDRRSREVTYRIASAE